MTQTKKNDKKNPAIIHLTESAIAKIKDMMKKDGKEDSALRVDVATGGCAGLSYSLRFQKSPYDNDLVFEQGGLKVYLNPDTIPFLSGIEIDYIDTLNASGFQYKNPNAKSTCGCGVSFS